MHPRPATSLIRATFAAAVIYATAGCSTPGGKLPGGEPRSAQQPAQENLVARLGGESWVSYDGESFPYTRWGPKWQPKTVVVAVHGLSGAASDFEPLGEYFGKHSTAVYSYELRGQGLDPVKSRVGDIKNPDLWYADLDTFLRLVREANPRARLFLYGESLGCLISVYGMESLSPDNQQAIRGLILSSPVVSLKDRSNVPRLKYAALRGAMRVLPRRKISLEQLAGDERDMRITADTDHRENIRDTAHAVDKFSFRLLGTLERLIDGSYEKATGIKKPVLVLYPAHDLLTTPEDVEAWYAVLGSQDKEKHLFRKSFHMLLYDEERAAVLERVRNWLDRH